MPPLGPRCRWRLFPDTLLDVSQFCCFQTPESAFWNACVSAVLEVEAQGGVTGSLSGCLSVMGLLSEPPRGLWAGPDFLLSPTLLHKSFHRLLTRGTSPCFLGCSLFLSCWHAPYLPPEIALKGPCVSAQQTVGWELTGSNLYLPGVLLPMTV